MMINPVEIRCMTLARQWCDREVMALEYTEVKEKATEMME